MSEGERVRAGAREAVGGSLYAPVPECKPGEPSRENRGKVR